MSSLFLKKIWGLFFLHQLVLKRTFCFTSYIYCKHFLEDSKLFMGDLDMEVTTLLLRLAKKKSWQMSQFLYFIANR